MDAEEAADRLLQSANGEVELSDEEEQELQRIVNEAMPDLPDTGVEEVCMDEESGISGRDTYVLDEDELDQLDDLSLTSVIEEATSLFAQPNQEPEEGPPEIERTDDSQDGRVN